MTGFSERMARHLGRPVDAACSVRAPFTTLAVALAAGAGAGIGSFLGGPLVAGAVAGGAVIVAYVILWFETRASGTSLNMALVLEEDQVELLQLRAIGTRPVRTLRSIPYADITGVDVEDRWLELKITIRTARDSIAVNGGKRGVGAAPPVVDELRRRIAA
jgi:hypothetical protein